MNEASVVASDHIGAHVGERVTLRGRLDNRRSSSTFHCLEARDGSGIVPCVMARADSAHDAIAFARMPSRFSP